MEFSFTLVTSRRVWDDFVLRHSPYALFQSWLWGEVEKREGKHLWRIGIFADSKLVGVMQVTKIFARRGTFLHVRHGPVFTHFEKKILDVIVIELKRLAKQERALFIRVSPLIPNTLEFHALFHDVGGKKAAIHAMDAEVCWVLDLGASDEELLRDMRKTTRYEILAC